MANFQLRLTSHAEEDLRELYRYGYHTWGEVQVDDYFAALLEQFDWICESPLAFPPVDEIRNGYRRCVFRRHSIYFVVNQDIIEVRAIVGQQELASKLNDQR